MTVWERSKPQNCADLAVFRRDAPKTACPIQSRVIDPTYVESDFTRFFPDLRTLCSALKLIFYLENYESSRSFLMLVNLELHKLMQVLCLEF